MKLEQTSPKRSYLAMVIIGGLCLILANSALWFNKYIFNTDNFTSTATEAITSESSRTAIANEIVDRLGQNRPVLKSVLDDPAQKFIVGVLDSTPVQQGLNRTVQELHTIITSKDPQSVMIDLTAAKELVNKVVLLLNQTGRTVEYDISQIPDQVTVIDAAKLPNVYNMGVVLLWLGPIALIAALILFTLPIVKTWRSKRGLAKVFLWETLTLIGGGLLTYMLGPMFKPPVLAEVVTPNIQVVISNIYDSFLAQFNSQSWWFFILATIMAILTAVFYYLNWQEQKQTIQL